MYDYCQGQFSSTTIRSANLNVTNDRDGADHVACYFDAYGWNHGDWEMLLRDFVARDQSNTNMRLHCNMTQAFQNWLELASPTQPAYI